MDGSKQLSFEYHLSRSYFSFCIVVYRSKCQTDGCHLILIPGYYFYYMKKSWSYFRRLILLEIGPCMAIV